MAGLLVYLSKNKEVDEKKFEGALVQQQFRGPDFSEIRRINSSISFGANFIHGQRIGNFGDNSAVYDGEIYNHKELLDYLVSKYSIKLNEHVPDILACGLTLEGINFLPKINGEFALCFFDSKKQNLLVARDLVGVKSPYLYIGKDSVVVSSDIGSISHYSKLTLRKEYLYRMAFLDQFTGFDNSETVFEEIKTPEIGGYLVVSIENSDIKSGRYEKLNFEDKVLDVDEAERNFKPLIEKVFELETNSNEKMGIFLSGGIDSTAIITLATEHILKHQKRIPVFTYFFTEKGEDKDYIFSQKVLDYLKNKFGDVFDVCAINLDPRITEDDFWRTLQARQSPILDVREIMYVNLYQEAKKYGVKIVFNGMGSDEIYYGYYPLDYWMSIFYRQGNFNAGEVLNYYKNKLNQLKMGVYNDSFREKAESYCKSWLDNKFSKMPEISEQPKKVTWFLTETINPALLLREEKGGSYSGIEVRFPLVNPILAKFACLSDYKIHITSTNSGRHLVRKSLEGKLDNELIYREKNSGPKKRYYWDELQSIYDNNRMEIVNSRLLNQIYKTEFLQDPNIIRGKADYVIYGNENDIFLEMLGWFFFSKKFEIS